MVNMEWVLATAVKMELVLVMVTDTNVRVEDMEWMEPVLCVEDIMG